MTELEVNGVLIDDHYDNIEVNATTAQHVVVLTAEGGTETTVWQRTANLPDEITDFVATDNLEHSIQCSWTTGLLTDRVDLYEETLGEVATNITSTYSWVPPEPWKVYRLAVVAFNAEGHRASNVDNGRMTPHGNVTVDYNSVSGSNPETVTGSGPNNWLFTPPLYVDAITIDMTGAGGGAGGGAGATSGGVTETGERGNGGKGGAPGVYINQTIDIQTNDTFAITIGAGGSGGTGGDGGHGGCDEYGDDGNPGSAGSATTFGTLTANGGAGGAGGDGAANNQPTGGSCNGMPTCVPGAVGTTPDGPGGAGQYGGSGGGGGGGDSGDPACGDGDDGVSGGAGGNGRIIINW